MPLLLAPMNAGTLVLIVRAMSGHGIVWSIQHSDIVGMDGQTARVGGADRAAVRLLMLYLLMLYLLMLQVSPEGGIAPHAEENGERPVRISCCSAAGTGGLRVPTCRA